MNTELSNCKSVNIAAYVEGELDASVREDLEKHFAACASCAAELQAQRLFMCELDSALSSPFDLAVPPNFAQVVAVHAESDMRGVRNLAEHKRALRFCVILLLAAVALLGFASAKAALVNAGAFASKVFGVLGFFGEAIFKAAAGFSVFTKVASRGVLPDSGVSLAVGLMFVAILVAMLSRLIARYHRTRVID